MGAGQNIAGRMADYFGRQVALYEEMLEDFQTLSERLQAEDLGPLATKQRDFSTRSAQLEEELSLLLREWRQATDIREADRKRVRALAGKARRLAGQLEAYSRDASERTRVRQDEVRSALEGLRRGQQMLTKYRIDDDPAGYMDTKA